MTDNGAHPRDRTRRWPAAPRLGQMTLRGRLRAVFIVALVLLIASLAVSAFSFARLLESRSTLYNEIDPAQLASEQLLAAFLNQETGVRGFVLTGQEAFLLQHGTHRSVVGKESSRNC